MCNTIAVLLAKIFNKSLVSGIFPDALKIVRIAPVFKSEDKNVKNYHPISLLPALSKILEKLMLNRLIVFLNKHNVLKKHQHGFRQNFSTITALADVLDYITSKLDNKLFVLALLIDISKAFDSLNYNMLLTKLEHYGVRGVVLNWFNSYLTGRYQYTEINGSKSLLKSIVCGIPQGFM